MELLSDFYPFDPSRPHCRTECDDDEPGDKTNHKMTPATNTWNAGYMIYLMMTLNHPGLPNDLLERILDSPGYDDTSREWTKSMDLRRLSGGLFLDNGIHTELPSSNYADYSEELKDLVLSCTRIQPYERPSAQSVKAAARAGIEREWRRLQQEFPGDEAAVRIATRVPLDNSEWNKIPHGLSILLMLQSTYLYQKEMGI